MFNLKAFLSSGSDHASATLPSISQLAESQGFRPRTIGERVTIGDVIIYGPYRGPTPARRIERVMGWKDMPITKDTEAHAPYWVLTPVSA